MKHHTSDEAAAERWFYNSSRVVALPTDPCLSCAGAAHGGCRRSSVGLTLPLRTHATAPEPGTPAADGKFLRVDGAPFLVRGVSYGAFAPRRDGQHFPEHAQIRRDCALMVRAGINTIRTYTLPPRDLLDTAAEYGLRVMAGLAWPQHVAFLDDRQLRANILRNIGRQAKAAARHPAVLLMAIGNEIPPAVVRWHGARSIERFIGNALDEARAAAPSALFTYVNYPPTEFLELAALDVCAFNVYLHDERTMRAYVARLQHIAGPRPLLLSECGADSQRLGDEGQAAVTAVQLRAAFAEGAAGAIVFGWTDEWWRGGTPIVDWSFGIVDRDRRPKPAFAAVAGVFGHTPPVATAHQPWPSVTVVVCAYNAGATIDDCLEALERIDYPHLEVIVVDDGSTDDTAARVRARGRARLIEIPNGGLSAARNVGAHAARHEIVAYVDADVRVEPYWLTHLVQPFMTSTAIAVGGPNVVPPDDHWFAQCVARAPGAPSHVLVDDRLADHVPGCNLAIRRSALLAIGGFDPIFLRAGDDVDVCWRLQAEGGDVTFAAAALVWHHHRASLTAYWRQQVGYGEGEAWLRLRHRHRFSRSGLLWRGRIYSALPFVQSLTRRRVHAGVWGTAAFPSVYHTGARRLQALPHTAGWLVTSGVLVASGALGWVVTSTITAAIALVAGLIGLGVTSTKCVMYARRSDLGRIAPLPQYGRFLSQCLFQATIATLHLVQPVARFVGYIRGTLRPPPAVVYTEPLTRATPRRHLRPALALLVGRPARCVFWSETRTSLDSPLTGVVERLRTSRAGRGVHVDDGWRADRDVSLEVGSWAWAHIRTLVEDHGSGRCLWRVRMDVRPRIERALLLALLPLALVVSGANSLASAVVIATSSALLFLKVVRDLARAIGEVLEAVTAVAGECGMQSVSSAVHEPHAKTTLSRWRRLSVTQGG